MSVYLPHLEKPKCCSYCPMFNSEYEFCQLTETDVPNSGVTVDWCPLVPVPDHGRLIDADALEDYVIALRRDAIHAYEWTGKSGEWSTRIAERERFAVMIEDEPTIIPAEEEAEG